MDSKTRLYVFAKKEVALIFVFMILIAITSFVLGVKIGKNYTLGIAGVTVEDQKKVVDMLSGNEEELKSIKENQDTHKLDNSEVEKKLQEKISSEFGAPLDHGTEAQGDHTGVKQSVSAASKNMSSEEDNLSGKLTIQLGSHRSLKEAEDFAEGFKARGYDPIINQIEIKGKGTWYRVSLGAFSTNDEAKAFIAKEKTLFIGQDYNIVKMP